MDINLVWDAILLISIVLIYFVVLSFQIIVI